jgi:hypothetical protein
MRMMWTLGRRRSTWATAVLAGTLVACAGDSAAPSPPPGPAVQIVFDRDSLVLDALEDTARVTAIVRDARGNTTTDPIMWTVTDAAVASVDASGRVRSVGPGRTTILARAGTIVDSVLVRVTPVARSVAFAADTLRFATIGRTQAPSVTVRDRNAVPLSAPTRRWSTTDPAVASVTPEGVLTAHSAGTTVLVVEVDALRDTAVVLVRPVAARLALSTTGLVVDVGATSTVTVSAVDSGGTAIASSAVARFVSRDPNVATIDLATGVVHGLSAGTTVIVASGVDDPTLTDTAAVVVAAPGWVIGRASIVGADPSGVAPGSTLTLRITIDASRLPQVGALGAAEATLRWDPTVLALDSLRSTPLAAANQTSPGVVAVAYAAAEAVLGGTIEVAALYLRVLPSVTTGRDAGLVVSATYPPVGLDFAPIMSWAALSDRVRVR